MRALETSLIALSLALCGTGAFAQDKVVAGGAALGLGIIDQPGRPFPGTALGLPTLEGEKPATGIGPSGGLALALEIARFEDIPIFFELSGSFVATSSNSRSLHDLAGRDSVLLAVGNPAGVVDLSASGGAASASVVGSDAGNVTVTGSSVPGGGGEQSVLGYNRSGDAASFAAVSTSGDPRAAAYGVLLSPQGFAFLGEGDMSGTLLQSTISRSSFRAGLEATFGAPIPMGDGWSIVPRLGGVYRHSGDEARHEVIIDAFEGAGIPDRIPTVGLIIEEELVSNMAGPLASISISKSFDPRWSAMVGVDAGWLFGTSQWTTSGTGLMEGMQPTALPGQSVDSFVNSGIVRLKGGVSYAADNGTIFSLNGQVEHLTSAPQARTVASTPAAGPVDLGLQTATTTIVGAPTFDYGISISMTRRF